MTIRPILTIAVQLSAVDTESILADAGRHDNARATGAA